MSKNIIQQLMAGITEAKRGNTQHALDLFRNAAGAPYLPEAKAWEGYCLARENDAYKQGIALCNAARQSKPGSSDICLALGRIYLLAGLRSSAVRALETGLKIDKNPEIYNLLNSIGTRKPPVFRFLHRDSRVNVTSGRLLARMGVR